MSAVRPGGLCCWRGWDIATPLVRVLVLEGPHQEAGQTLGVRHIGVCVHGCAEPIPPMIARHPMRGAVLHAPGDVRVEDRADPAIVEPTDAVIRLSATCVCGSYLWSYGGIQEVDGPSPMGHEYVGVVEDVGDEVTTVRPGQFVIGSF